jgi:hypothetical protein
MTRLGTHLRFAVLSLTAAAVLAGCFTTKYHYVKNGKDDAYFRIPDEWKLYDEDAVLKKLAKGSTEEERDQIREITWQVGFDAAPKPSLNHFFDPRAKFPAGRAQVYNLTAEESDQVSLADLRNFSVGIDELIQSGSASIVDEERVELDEGFRGLHVIAKVVGSDDGDVLTYNQILLLDQATTKLYEITVVCGSACYDHHEKDIKRIIKSWTVGKN